MKKLKEIFNSEAFRDHAEGAVMGMSIGYALSAGQLPGLVVGGFVGGFMGLIMGRQRITEMFNAVVSGRQMAAMVPVPVPARVPKP